MTWPRSRRRYFFKVSKDLDDDLLRLGEDVAVNIPPIAVLSTLKPTSAQIDAAAQALSDAMAIVGPGPGSSHPRRAANLERFAR
jgi:hypothetical protein